MAKETKLSKMFRLLRKQGFIAKRRFWCCQSCAWGALNDEEGENVVFMHQQDEQGWREKGVTHLAWSGNGQAIVDAAYTAGLEVEWDGSELTRVKITNPDFVLDKGSRMW